MKKQRTKNEKNITNVSSTQLAVTDNSANNKSEHSTTSLRKFELTAEQFNDIVDFWMFVLPNDIDRNIFTENLKTFISNSTLDEIQIDIKGIDGTGSLQYLVNGNNTNLQSANPYKVPLYIHDNSQNRIWPLNARMSNKLEMIIDNNKKTIEISHDCLSSTLVTGFLKYHRKNSSLYRGYELFLNSEFNKNSADGIDPKMTFKWPLYHLFLGKRKHETFSETLYQQIINTTNELQQEYLSSWPYPNKSKKLVKIKALTELVLELYNSPYKPIEEIIANLMKKYPQATDGTISHRVRTLFETLVPPKPPTKNTTMKI